MKSEGGMHAPPIGFRGGAARHISPSVAGSDSQESDGGIYHNALAKCPHCMVQVDLQFQCGYTNLFNPRRGHVAPAINAA
jgi:hypothetical protein